MSLTKKNRPTEKSGREFDEKGVRQTSEEVNRNEERVSPTGKGTATDQWNQRSKDIDRSSGRTTPITEKPDIAADSWKQQRHHTTGSNVPGSEISDRTNPNAEQMRQTSSDKYPKSGKSTPGPDVLHNQGQWDSNAMNKSGRVYTGNSERSGQQYSEGNTSQNMDRKQHQQKNQADQSHGSTLSEKQRNKKSRGMNAPAKDLDPTGTTTPRQRSQQNKKTDSDQEC